MARPLAVIGFTYFLCLTAATVCGLAIAVLFALLLSFFFLISLALRPVRRKTGFMAALLAAVAAFSVFSCVEAYTVRPLQDMAGQMVPIRAMVLEKAESSGMMRYYTLEVIEEGALPKGTRLYLSLFDPDVAPDAWDVVSGEVSLSRADEGRSGLFPYGRSDGVYLSAEPLGWNPSGLTEEGVTVRPWYAPLRELQRQARNLVQWTLPGDEGALIARISFGAQTNITSEVKSDFRGAGLSHLLAVSGLHTSVITGAVMLLLRLLRIPRRGAAVAAMAGVLFFMGFTGFQPSVMRAGIMNLVLMAGYVVNREADGLNSLGLAVLLLSLFNPGAACDVGLLLSFSATWGLLCLCPGMQRALEQTNLIISHPGVMRVAKPLMVTAAATVAPLPVITVIYGAVSLTSPLANLLAVPAASLLMILCCLSALLSVIPLLSLLATPLLIAAGILSEYLMAVARITGGTALSFVPLDEPYILLWLAGTVLLFLAGRKLLHGRGMRMAAAFSLVTLTVGVLINTAAMQGVTTVTALDIGEGVAVLLEREGHTVLLASGGRKGMMWSVSGALEDAGVDRLELLILPNPNDGAVFGVGALLETVQVDCVLSPPSRQLDAFAGDMAQLDMENGIASFWNTCTVEERGGFVRVELGDTRLLVCTENAQAALLPDEWRQVHLAIFDGSIPTEWGIDARQGIVSCSRWQLEDYPAITASYPVELTARQGGVYMMTWGEGDMDVRCPIRIGG